MSKGVLNIVRVGELKMGDVFIMDNTEYEVVKIENGFLFYKTILCSSVGKNNFMSFKSQKRVEKKD